MKPGKNKGTKNFKNKLSESDVLEIFNHKSKLTQEKIAQKYNISQSTVNHILTQRTWKWLTSTEETPNENRI